MGNKILYSIGYFIRGFFSFLGRILKKTLCNWDRLRKVLVILLFAFLCLKQFANPDIQASLNSEVQTSVTDLEKQAVAYSNSYEFKKSLDAYEPCLKIIVSQKGLSNIKTPLDVQMRICKNAAYTFLEYSFGKPLSDSDEKLRDLIISGLEVQKKINDCDEEVDILIDRLNNRR